MEVDFSNLSWHDTEKALLLLNVAHEMEYDLSRDGACTADKASGNVYLWVDNEAALMYIPCNAEINRENIIFTKEAVTRDVIDFFPEQ